MFFIVSACDKIPADERRTAFDGINESQWKGQYILLQDFTGVRCVNCPASTQEIERIKGIFGDKLIVVKMHPKMPAFNTPLGTSPDAFGHNQDLGNSQAEQYRLFYQIQALPSGIVMQKNEPLNHSLFFSKVLSYYYRQAIATIDLTASLAGNTISINTTVSFTGNHTGTGNTHLSLMIIENNLQVIQQAPVTPIVAPDGFIRDYIQNNVLRAVATPLWGNEIAGNNIEKDRTFTHRQTIELDEIWKRENLSIIAVLFDNDTKNVVQAAKITL